MNDDILIQALALYEERWLASLPTEEELSQIYTFSLRFERRMARLFSQQKKPYYPYVNRAWKRAVLAAAIALMILGASMSVSAIREPVIRFIVKIYERFSSMLFVAEKEIEEWLYRPSYLPDNYLLVYEEQFKWVIIQHYENTEGDEITLRQYRLTEFEFQVDTENVAIEDIEVKGQQGIFYRNKGWSNLVWSDGQFSFWLVARLHKEDMIKIALSVEFVD